MTWMILICHLPERSEKLRRLTRSLDKQKAKFPGLVDYKINDSGRGMPTGIKRNMLIEQTQSDYFNFADDDDMVADNYIEEGMKAIEKGVEVVTFDGFYTEFGKNRREFTIRLGSKYYEDPKDQFFYHRFPNHLAVMRRERVQKIAFPPIWQGEDFQWADRIRSLGLLKTEYHIDLPLYHYDCYPKMTHHARRQR